MADTVALWPPFIRAFSPFSNMRGARHRQHSLSSFILTYFSFFHIRTEIEPAEENLRAGIEGSKLVLT